MEDRATGFEDGQWCLLELMGHRKLAGFVREVSVGGAAMLRIDVPNGCDGGVTARWCPRCGDCKCPKEQGGTEWNVDPACPIHREGSDHGDTTVATQFYGGASVYCITPITEAIARKLAASYQAKPVTVYDLPRRERQLAPAGADFDDDFEN